MTNPRLSRCDRRSTRRQLLAAVSRRVDWRTLCASAVVVVGLVVVAGATPVAAHGSDYDSDGLADDEELEYGTDIEDRDTDGDGLIDGVEVYATKTDPTNPDTDGDGVPDGREDAAGSDPNDPTDTPTVWSRFVASGLTPYALGGGLAVVALVGLALGYRRWSRDAT